MDAMSDAIEGAEVMLYGVSLPYKESANCRLEANYAMQQELDMIPCMMQDGFRAKGWLGLILGTAHSQRRAETGEIWSNKRVRAALLCLRNRYAALVRVLGLRRGRRCVVREAGLGGGQRDWGAWQAS